MWNLLVIACFLFSFSIFSQNKNIVVKDSTYRPTSIFAIDSPIFEHDNEGISPLRLTGHKFLVVDNSTRHFNSSNFQINFKNFGRSASFEDISDNYNKAILNNYEISSNNDHFIWSMWDTRLQKQWQQDLQKVKN